jgi:carbon-monoxide dehydrogenase large subunit
VEDARFLTGRATYVDDVHLPGMVHCAFVRSPHAHARVLAVDTTRARGLAGVVAVLTGEDLADVAPMTTTIATRPEDVKVSTRPLLARDRVRHVGDPVAVVVASSRYVAEDAAELVDVQYEPLPAVVDAEAALAPDAPVLHEELGDNCFSHVEFEKGDVDRLFAEADHVFARRFHYGRSHAAPLETRGVVGAPDRGSDGLTVWTSSQFPHLVRTLLHYQLGLPENRMRVIAPDVGGGFGLKVHLHLEEILIPYLALQLGRPVKWIEDRYENLVASGHAKEMICDLELATSADGTFLAMRGRYIGDAGAYQGHPWTALVDVFCAATFLPNLYRLQGVAYSADCVFTNKCQSTAYRGVGWTPGHVAREALIDDAARALGIDPLELRLKNTISDEPQVSLTGCNYDGGSYSEAQRRAAELVGYDDLRRRQVEARAQGRYIGIGVSPFVEQGAWAAELAHRMGFPGYGYMDSASVTVEADGSVTVTTGLHSQGQGHETALAQLTADRLGVPLDTVRIVQGDTASGAYSTGTYGSRTAVVGGGAIRRAAGDVRDKLVHIAAHMLEASPGDIELVDGTASVRGTPDRAVTVPQIAFTTYLTSARPTDIEVALTSTRSYDPPETYSNACIIAVVDVDVETGVVRVERIAVAEDCGTVLNPMIVDGQLAGAVAQGLGAALLEELPYSADGQPLSSTLLDFLYPSSMDVPELEIVHLETPSPVTEGGMKGMAEGGNIGAPSAIVNAVADALAPFGVHVTSTPLGPSHVLDLLREARERTGSGSPAMGAPTA